MAQPTNNYWLRFGPVLTALDTKLRAVMWDPPGGGSVAAFGTVGTFDLSDLAQALRELLVVSDRAALIIYQGTQYDARASGRDVTAECVRDISILVTDRDVGNRMAALVGGEVTPGAALLADLVAERLLGSLPIPGVDAAGASRLRGWVEIVATTPFAIEDRVRDVLVGRTAMVVRLLVHCGDAGADLGGSHV
jgi:hypothetical protein